MTNNLSSIQNELDKKGLHSHIYSNQNQNKHDLIINYQVRATSPKKATLVRILKKLLKSLPPQ